MSKSEIGLMRKLARSLHNGLEQYWFKERFLLSDRTAYRVVYQDRLMSLRHYEPLADDTITVSNQTLNVNRLRHPIPLLLVPPLAATSIIFDLMPQRSVVRFFLAQGFDVYLVDWGEVTADHTDISLETYVMEWMPRVVSSVLETSGAAQLSIFSYCMGGLLSLMYLATSESQHVKNLVTVASPIDMHSSGAAGKVLATLYGPAKYLSAVFNFSLLDLPGKYFHVPGWVSSLAFKMTNPVGTLINTFDRVVNLWDRDYLKESLTMSKWFDDMVDYPGSTVKEMAVHMMLNNSLATGRVKIGRVRARCDNIRCNLLAFAGEDDVLVSAPAARKVLDIVSSTDKTFCIVPGGHAGVFAGSGAPEHTWQIASDWLRDRSSVITSENGM